MATHAGTLRPWNGRLERLNTQWHERAVVAFGAVVALHWAEHVIQAFQIWVLGYKKPAAKGLIGAQFPWLVTSEWLHYGFAVVMLVGLAVLLPGFGGRAWAFWLGALGIQVWHFVEHQILFLQATTGHYWFGAKVPTSVVQQFWPMSRPEIHLVYNALVTIPMVVALYFHMYPPRHERGASPACTCDRTAAAAPLA